MLPSHPRRPMTTALIEVLTSAQSYQRASSAGELIAQYNLADKSKSASFHDECVGNRPTAIAALNRPRVVRDMLNRRNGLGRSGKCLYRRIAPRSAASAVTPLEVRTMMPAGGVHVTPCRTAVAVLRSRARVKGNASDLGDDVRRVARCAGDCAAWQPTPGCHERPCTGEAAYPRIESSAMGVGPSRR